MRLRERFRVPSLRAGTFVLLASLVCLVRPPAAGAQPLADKVPGDALIYAGWGGVDHMGPAYAESHLKAFLDHSNFPQLVNQTLPALLRRAAEENPNAAAPLQLLSTLGPILWRHPAAFYFGGLDMAPNQLPVPKIAILVDAGQDAGPLLTQIQGLLANIPPQVPIQVQATNYNGLVCVSLGRTSDFDALLGGKATVPAAESLAARKEFKGEMDAQVKNGADTVAAMYVDAAALLKLIDSLVARSPDPTAPQKWGQARDLLGLESVRQVLVTAGFDGRDWATATTIATNGKLTGLASALESKPLGDDILKTLPQSATFAGAGRLNLALLFGQLRDLVTKVNPGARANVDRALAAASDKLGLDIQKELLEPLGDEWAVYCSPGVGGNGVLGMVLVNRLADAPKAEASLNKLEGVVNQQIVRQSPPKAKITLRQTKVGDLTVHYLPVPLVGPSWAISDGNWYAGLYPQVVASAAGQGKSGGKSILDNEDFVALRKRLGGEKASSIAFYDLPRTANDGYQLSLALTQFVQGGAAMQGVDVPPLLLPPLDQLLPHMTPAMSVTWSDRAGWHQKSISPFPGATMLGSPQSLLLNQTPLLASVVLPSLNRARQTATRASAMSNLRQIGMGCLLYANENNGKFPPNLGALLQEDLTLQTLAGPTAQQTIPADVLRGTPEAKAAWLNAHSDYVYLGAGKTSATARADTVIAYEKLEGNSQGIGVVYGDGHCDFQTAAAARKLLEGQKGD